MEVKKSVTHHRQIDKTEQVCYNCQHMLWMIALGLGVRCGENTPPKMIPHLRHTCEKFEFRKKQEDEEQS